MAAWNDPGTASGYGNGPGFGGFNSNMFGAGLGGLLGGLFGDSGAPYDKAMEQYQKYGQMGQDVQNPYLNAGQQGLGNYQNWLNGMQNPSQFINDQMKNYSESPYNQYLQNQSMRAGQNAASASGLMGSTPFLQQSQQNAANIGQQGMDEWLKNVLGINQMYGQGNQNLITGGQNAANNLTNIYQNLGNQMGQASYGKEAGKQQDFWNAIGGGLGMLGSFFL